MGGESRARETTRILVGCCTVVSVSLGCATKQAIPLDCVSEDVVVYVDGRLLEENPDVLELSADEPHKLYFKRPGHDPQLIVLESQTDEQGKPRLSPGAVCVQLVPVGLARELTIELEEDPGDGPD
jgi:hypothetical protein